MLSSSKIESTKEVAYFAALLILWTLIVAYFMSGCAASTKSSRTYGEIINSKDISNEYLLDDVDLGIDILATELQKAGLKADWSAFRNRQIIIISTRLIMNNEGQYVVGLFVPPATSLPGISSGGSNVLWVKFDPEADCLATTSLLHEFTHAILCDVGSSYCDAEHKQVEYWAATHTARAIWTNQVCEDKIEVPALPQPITETPQ